VTFYNSVGFNNPSYYKNTTIENTSTYGDCNSY
jgi:hypothetical protein